jgi:hypothetical protein
VEEMKTRHILETLREVRNIAEMKHASFRKPSAEIGSRDYWNNDAYTKEIAEATRLWRQSWIIGPLDEIIEMLEKELNR